MESRGILIGLGERNDFRILKRRPVEGDCRGRPGLLESVGYADGGISGDVRHIEVPSDNSLLEASPAGAASLTSTSGACCRYTRTSRAGRCAATATSAGVRRHQINIYVRRRRGQLRHHHRPRWPCRYSTAGIRRLDRKLLARPGLVICFSRPVRIISSKNAPDSTLKPLESTAASGTFTSISLTPSF